MTLPDLFPTAYPEINTLLRLLHHRVQEALGGQLVGLYLHGSLAGGDFEPGRSDIDFLVVTTVELPEETQAQLAAMHAQITASGLPWAEHMEGSYIPKDALRRYDPAQSRHPALRVDGSFDVDFHASDWIIQRYVLREKGIPLSGPPLKTLIDPIHPDDLRRAALRILMDWWEPMLRDPRLLCDSEYQAYAVVTMCRVLYTIVHGDVVSKPAAVRWAQKALDLRWQSLIAQGLSWRQGMTMDVMDEVLGFIRYTIERAKSEAAAF